MTELVIDLPEKLAPLWEPKRYKVMYGGRGGGKSVSVAKWLLASGYVSRLRILCTREVQKSIKDSVLALLRDEVTNMGLSSFYEVQSNAIKGANGTEFIFAGLQDHTVDSIRSFSNVDVCWVEEAHSVSARSWSILVPTIRKEGSEIVATFNPDQEADEVYRRFVTGKDDQAWVCKIGWQDNPWFPKVLESERLALKAFNEDLYAHVWEGQCRSAAGLLMKRAWAKHYDKAPTNLHVYLSSDFAVTAEADADGREPDWTEHGVFGVDEVGDTYIIDWWSGQTDPDTSLKAWLALVRRHKPIMSFDEAGVIHRALDPARNRMMRETQTFVRVETLASAGNKAARAMGFAARMAAGTVWLPKGQDWAVRLLNQLCAFNGEDGRVDDMVDACSLFARGLDYVANARPDDKAKKAKSPPVLSHEWFDARERMDRESRPDADNFYL